MPIEYVAYTNTQDFLADFTVHWPGNGLCQLDANTLKAVQFLDYFATLEAQSEFRVIIDGSALRIRIDNGPTGDGALKYVLQQMFGFTFQARSGIHFTMKVEVEKP